MISSTSYYGKVRIRLKYWYNLKNLQVVLTSADYDSITIGSVRRQNELLMRFEIDRHLVGTTASSLAFVVHCRSSSLYGGHHSSVVKESIFLHAALVSEAVRSYADAVTSDPRKMMNTA